MKRMSEFPRKKRGCLWHVRAECVRLAKESSIACTSFYMHQRKIVDQPFGLHERQGARKVVGKRQLYPSWLILRDPQIGPAAQREIWLGEILEKTEWPIDELICAPNPIENVIVVVLLRVRIQVDHIAINNGFVLVDRDVCQPAVDHANHGILTQNPDVGIRREAVDSRVEAVTPNAPLGVGHINCGADPPASWVSDRGSYWRSSGSTCASATTICSSASCPMSLGA